MAKATPKQVHEPAESLRALWQAGHESLKRLRRHRRAGEYRYGTKQEILEQEAAKEQLNHDTMKKAWRVAEEYTKDDIQKLCALIERRQAPFSATHLIRLLSLPRGPRDTLARTAIRKRWTVRELRAAILQRRERRPHVGRHPHVPKDLAGRLVVLEGLCLTWVRWCSSDAARLPPVLKKRVDRATRAVERVRDAAVEGRQNLRSQAGRRKRKQ